MTWYAWSPIDYGAEHDEKDRNLILKRNVIPVGEEVSPGDIGLEEDSDDWKQLVAEGVVRDYEFPDELRDPNTSPQKIVSAKVRALEDGVDTGQLDAATMAALMQRPKSATEGQNEVSPEGTVTKADSPPPTPSQK